MDNYETKIPFQDEPEGIWHEDETKDGKKHKVAYLSENMKLYKPVEINGEKYETVEAALHGIVKALNIK